MSDNNVDIDSLIKLVQQRSALYDHQSPQYSNRNIVDKLWMEISEEMKIPVSVIKTKWNQLRNSFGRICRENKAIPSGSGGQEKKKKKWYLEEKLLFLKPCMQHRRSNILNANSPEFISGESMQDVDNTDNTSSSYTQHRTRNELLEKRPQKKERGKKGKKKTDSKAFEKVSEAVLKFLECKGQQQDESYTADDMFFLSVSKDSRKLSGARKRKFKLSVQTMLCDALEEEEQDRMAQIILHE